MDTFGHYFGIYKFHVITTTTTTTITVYFEVKLGDLEL
jgi:hypothetical protein